MSRKPLEMDELLSKISGSKSFLRFVETFNTLLHSVRYVCHGIVYVTQSGCFLETCKFLRCTWDDVRGCGYVSFSLSL